MFELLSDIVVALVALMHVGFLVLEMFFWEHEIGLKVFRQDAARAAATRVLAANQGLYNGFLAAGLFWGLAPSVFSHDVKVFFLVCVIVAGAYGAWSVSRRILWVQATPAALGLVFTLLA